MSMQKASVGKDRVGAVIGRDISQSMGRCKRLEGGVRAVPRENGVGTGPRLEGTSAQALVGGGESRGCRSDGDRPQPQHKLGSPEGRIKQGLGAGGDWVLAHLILGTPERIPIASRGIPYLSPPWISYADRPCSLRFEILPGFERKDNIIVI